MPHYRWEEVREEKLNPWLSRRFIAGERVMLAQIHLKKGGLVPVHKHVHEQFSHVLKGSVKFTLSGRKYVLNEGEVLHIPSNKVHSAEAAEDSEVLDVFSPIREDWLSGDDGYLRDVKTPGKPKRKPSKKR